MVKCAALAVAVVLFVGCGPSAPSDGGASPEPANATSASAESAAAPAPAGVKQLTIDPKIAKRGEPRDQSEEARARDPGHLADEPGREVRGHGDANYIEVSGGGLRRELQLGCKAYTVLHGEVSAHARAAHA